MTSTPRRSALLPLVVVVLVAVMLAGGAWVAQWFYRMMGQQVAYLPVLVIHTLTCFPIIVQVTRSTRRILARTA